MGRWLPRQRPPPARRPHPGLQPRSARAPPPALAMPPPTLIRLLKTPPPPPPAPLLVAARQGRPAPGGCHVPRWRADRECWWLGASEDGRARPGVGSLFPGLGACGAPQCSVRRRVWGPNHVASQPVAAHAHTHALSASLRHGGHARALPSIRLTGRHTTAGALPPVGGSG